MNAQLPITTTPKYNFPLPQETLHPLELPKHFTKLSLLSLKPTQQKQRLSTKDTATQLPTHLRLQQSISSTELFPLTPNPIDTTIVAIDVSSIRLGETETGFLLGVRGAIVWKESKQYRYLRLGPFPFHITQRTEDEIRRLYRQDHPISRLQVRSIPQVYIIQSRLTTLLERWMQSFIIRTTRNSIILWDGSLAVDTTETPASTIKELLTAAHNNGNIILAFSKMTRLSLHGRRLTDLIFKHPPPCLLRIKEHINHFGQIRLMGNVYVAKFTKGKLAFRMDADKRRSSIEVVEAVQNLLGNDSILQSYPETLRLAHIFSTFTATEVLALQRCITQKSGLRVITTLNLRRLLFGRFGKTQKGC